MASRTKYPTVFKYLVIALWSAYGHPGKLPRVSLGKEGLRESVVVTSSHGVVGSFFLGSQLLIQHWALDLKTGSDLETEHRSTTDWG